MSWTLILGTFGSERVKTLEDSNIKSEVEDGLEIWELPKTAEKLPTTWSRINNCGIEDLHLMRWKFSHIALALNSSYNLQMFQLLFVVLCNSLIETVKKHLLTSIRSQNILLSL